MRLKRAVQTLGKRALGRALHEWRVSLIDDRGSRSAMAAQDGARKRGGRADAYVFSLISDWRGVRRLLVVPSGPLSIRYLRGLREGPVAGCSAIFPPAGRGPGPPSLICFA